MFVWRDFREDGKFRREKWRERSFNGCLVGRESGKNCDEVQVFSSWATKKFSPQNREKSRGRSSLTWAAQNAPTHSSLLTFFASSLSLIYAHSCCFGFFCFISLFFFFFLLFLLLSYFFFFLSFVFITFFYRSFLLLHLLHFFFFFFLSSLCLWNNN